MDWDRFAYKSYMLRLWLEDDHDDGRAGKLPGEWRASLEEPQTRRVYVFANLEAMFEFLLAAVRHHHLDDDHL